MSPCHFQYSPVQVFAVLRAQLADASGQLFDGCQGRQPDALLLQLREGLGLSLAIKALMRGFSVFLQ